MSSFKRQLAIFLAACMVMTNVLPAFAEPASELTGAMAQENVSAEDKASPSNAKYEKKDMAAQEEASPADAEYADLTELEDDLDDSILEVASPSVAKHHKDIFETVVDGVRITVIADKDVFPEGAELWAEKVEDADTGEAIDKAIEEEKSEEEAEKNIASRLQFDIKMFFDGAEIQPDTSKGTVMISFAFEEELNNCLDVNVYHVTGEDESLEAEALETEVATGEEVNEAEEIINEDSTDILPEIIADGTVVSAGINGFSYYVVEFTYNELQYVLNGDSSVKLSAILETLQLNGTVTAAESSNPELFYVTKDADEKDWTVTALQAFSSEEWMKVTIGGQIYEIVVTDEQEDASKDYLYFEAVGGDVTVKLQKKGDPVGISLEYAIVSGAAPETGWTDFAVDTGYPLSAGKRIYIRAKGTNSGFSLNFADYYHFSFFEGTGNIYSGGSVMSLLSNTCDSTIQLPTFCFNSLFYSNSKLLTAPQLPATKLGAYCYASMFSYCRGLKEAPELPATTLQAYCYSHMFSDCDELEQAPFLPAAELAGHCYHEMFFDCDKLNTVSVNFTDWGESEATYDWLKDVAKTGTFNCPKSLSTEPRDAWHIPSNWTIGTMLTVCLYANDETATTENIGVIIYNGSYTAPECPFTASDGKKFGGWAFTSDGLTVYNPGALIADTKTELYARWGTEICTVTFNSNGGVFPGGKTKITLNCLKDASITVCDEKPSWDTSCRFNNYWYTEPECQNQVTFPYKITENTTLYAGWNELYTVTWDANGGTFYNPSSTIGPTYIEKYIANETVKDVNTPNCYRDNYKPTYKWYMEPECKNQVDFSNYHMPAQNVTFYAGWVREYSLTWDANGGIIRVGMTDYETRTETKTENQVFTEFSYIPTWRTGGIFNGWYTDKECKEKVTFPYTVNKDDTFYAGWGEGYTVTWNANGGMLNENQETVVEYYSLNENVAQYTPDPTWGTEAGFNGYWYEDAECTKPVSFPYTMQEKNVTFYAGWDKLYTVTWDANGGMLNGNQETVVEYYSLAEEVAQYTSDPTWGTEARFNECWYEDAACTKPVSFPYTMQAKDVTFYAGWDKLYTVTWDANGGRFGDGTNTKTSQYLADDIVNVYSQNPTWSSTDQFDGIWYTDAACTTPAVFPYTIKDTDITFYAGWNHVISWYDENGTTLLYQDMVGHMKTPRYNGDLNYLIKDGKAFKGWTPTIVSANCSTSYKAVFETVLDGTVTVNFNPMGGSYVAAQTILKGKTATKPANPTKTGYTFVDWYTNEGCTLRFDFSTEINENTVVYAKWKENGKPDYTITWRMDDGSLLGTTQVTEGEMPTHADPTKEGFIFTGWDPTIVPATGNTTYKAKFVQRSADSVIVRFSLGDGLYGNTQVITKGSSVARPEDPVKTGYTFVDWYKDEGCTVVFDFSATINTDTTIYAKWKQGTDPQAEKVLVHFNSNGGSYIPSLQIEKGKTAAKPSDPTRSSYTFNGWFTDSALTTAYSFSTPVTADITLYAKWTYNGSSSGGGGGGGGGTVKAGSGKSTGATFSSNWYADNYGVWRIRNSAGQTVVNAWLCDDAVMMNGKNVWYLLTQDGAMLAAGLVQDNTGNFYSLETEHNGYFGMLRYTDGYYNCNGQSVYLTFNREHNGSFGAVTNADGLEKLKQIYGITKYGIGNENSVYTAAF